MATPGRTWAVIGLYQGRTKTGPGKGPGQDQGRTREGPGRAGPGRIREGLGRTIMDQKGPERTRTGTGKADLGPALDPDRLGKKRPRFQFFFNYGSYVSFCLIFRWQYYIKIFYDENLYNAFQKLSGDVVQFGDCSPR